MVGEQPVVAVWLLDRYRLSDVMHGLSIVMLVATALPLLALLALQNHPSQVAALAAACRPRTCSTRTRIPRFSTRRCLSWPIRARPPSYVRAPACLRGI